MNRAWTGFGRQKQRGNVETLSTNNNLDPMKIIAHHRDRFPKTDLYGGYIGDSYPLCIDLPPRAFLENGASYRLLGSSNLPELMYDDEKFASDDTIKKFTLAPTSNLKAKLCNKSQNGECRYHNHVTLESPISCIDIECNVDTVRVVEVTELVFYEYVQPPCVQQVFYDNAKSVSHRSRNKGTLCANPLLPVAAEACCASGKNNANRNAVYDGERMSFNSAVSRCDDIGLEACNFFYVKGDRHKLSSYFWTIDECLIQIKVNTNGLASIIHQPSVYTEKVLHVDNDNENWFTIYWDNDTFPSKSMECNGICEVSEHSCLCNTAVVRSHVFISMPESIFEITSKLHIGAFPITDSSTYTVQSESSTGISVYMKKGKIDIDSIFEFTDKGGHTRFLKNLRETVHVINANGESTDYSFRNMPQFMSFIPTEETVR